MAVTLADASTVHNYSTVDIPILLFGHCAFLDMSVRCHVLDFLSSDLVFRMDWLYTYNTMIDWIGYTLDLCIDGISLKLIITSAG